MPKARLTELLGWTNPGWEMDGVSQMLEETFAALQTRMADLRPVLLRDAEDPATTRDIYLFPEELKGLTASLSAYCDILFRGTRYSESPFLRGVYLTSALQTGSTVSEILRRLHLPPSALRTVESSRSYFLQDFFQERLGDDDRLVVPTGSATTRLRAANNLGLAAVATAAVLIAALASASYVRNRALLNRFQDALAGAVSLRGIAPDEQATHLKGYWSDLATLRNRVQHPDWLERFGLFQGAKALPVLEARVNSTYEAVAYRPALEAVNGALEGRGDARQSFNALSTAIDYLIETREAQKHDLEHGGEELAVWWNPEMMRDKDLRESFASAYRFYVRDPWRDSVDGSHRRQAEVERSAELQQVKAALPRLLTVPRVQAWLADFAEPMRLPREISAATEAPVSPAFTPQAWKERIQPLVAKIGQIEPELDGYRARSFVTDYADAYYRAWLSLLLSMREPADLDSADLGRYCSEDSPYFAALQTAHDGVAVAIPEVTVPPWVASIDEISAKKKDYAATVLPVCQLVRPAGDACSGLAHASGIDPVPAARDQLRQLVGAERAQDTEDRELRTKLEKLLFVPADFAGVQTVKNCERSLGDKFNAAGLRIPPAPRLDDIERVLAPGFGSAWQFCKEELSSFFDCRSARPLPGSRVHVPASITSFYQTADRLSRLLFDARGTWKQQTISFESLPSSDSGSGVRVTETSLTVSCQNLEEHPWTLRNRNTYVRKILHWQPDACDEARLEVAVGRADGSYVEQPPPRVGSGPFGLLELLSEASRQGDEFRWSFPEGVSAGFRVSLRDPQLLEFFKATRPR